ncbi:hypothetical protein [Deinococcus planocerae]|uniref:hypothetical protein n=1 Tax=Deinococcus planocerae TaxID=1737569 RepID=UPI0011AEED81|nr:hypothetical protein [Deinococcus planocerae]
MPRPRPYPLTRTLAALLVLAAAFAYPLRLGPVAGGGERPARAGEVAVHCPGAGQPEEAHHPVPPASPHGAHCLFCLTGAFALAAEPGVGLHPAAPAPPVARAPAPRPAHGPPTRLRARAPPPAAFL